MGSLALSTVVLFALLLPGIAFLARFESEFASLETAPTIEITATRTMAYAITLALVFHCVWIGALALVDHFLKLELTPSWHVLAIIGGGAPWDDANFRQHFSASALFGFSLYLLTQLLVAWMLGAAAVITLNKRGLGERRALRSRGAVWHRLLRYPDTDPPPDIIMLSLAVTMGGDNYLYYGILRDYQQDAEGNLHRVVLEGAIGEGLGGHSPPKRLPGESFVVNCDDVQTADIDYWWQDTSEETA